MSEHEIHPLYVALSTARKNRREFWAHCRAQPESWTQADEDRVNHAVLETAEAYATFQRGGLSKDEWLKQHYKPAQE